MVPKASLKISERRRETFPQSPHPRLGVLQANTLIEVLTSLSLLGIVFVLGWMLVGQQMGIQSPKEQARTRALVLNWLDEPVGFEAVNEAQRIEKGRRLVREISLQGTEVPLFLIEVSAYKGNTDQLLWKEKRYARAGK